MGVSSCLHVQHSICPHTACPHHHYSHYAAYTATLPVWLALHYLRGWLNGAAARRAGRRRATLRRGALARVNVATPDCAFNAALTIFLFACKHLWFSRLTPPSHHFDVRLSGIPACCALRLPPSATAGGGSVRLQLLRAGAVCRSRLCAALPSGRRCGDGQMDGCELSITRLLLSTLPFCTPCPSPRIFWQNTDRVHHASAGRTYTFAWAARGKPGGSCSLSPSSLRARAEICLASLNAL